MPPFSAICGPVELRRLTPRSAHQLFAMAREGDLTTYLAWQPHRTIDDSLSYIDDTWRLWDRRTAFLPGIFERERDRLIGTTGLIHIDRANRCAEVGSWIGIPHQGRGYNVPSKAAVFALAFDILGIQRLEMLVRVDNERSISAVEKIPCVIDEGILHRRIWSPSDSTSIDARIFAVTRETWDPSLLPAVTITGDRPAFG